MNVIRYAALFALIFSIAACASKFTVPADSANTWVEGRWSSKTPTPGNSYDLDLTVGDKNKVAGSVYIVFQRSGFRQSGDVEGSVEGNQIIFKATYLRGFAAGRVYQYKLVRREDGSLDGENSNDNFVLTKKN
jgi:hypothetical protein